ncbi:hypothetical protein CR513_59167, partial [Mucuna pruriens]
MTTSRYLSFSEEVPTEGKTHNQPLHITVKCRNYMIARVLIDNGSSLNVMPKTTLDKIYAPGAILKNSLVVVKAFDGSKREVMGEITLPICIGPTIFDITFQVMDIQLENLEFMLSEQFLYPRIKSTPLPIEYVEGDEEALETSFQALEIVGTTSVEEEKGTPKPSKATIMAAKILINNGFQPWQRVGEKTRRHSKANIEASSQIENPAFTPDDAGKSSRQEEKEETEEETLRELERLLEHDGPKLQSGAKELEVINLNEGEGVKEIWVGKLILPDIKQGLTELLREYADIFVWSY